MRLSACGDSVALRSRGTRFLALGLSAVILFSAACSSSPDTGGGRADAGRPAAAQQQVGVVTAEANQGALGLEIEAIGSAVANESAEITSKTVNTVTAIRFAEGQLVRRGTVLVEFDSAQAR